MKPIAPLIKLFERYSYAQNYANAFNQLLDYFLLAFRFNETKESRQSSLETLSLNLKKDLLMSIITEVGELAEEFGDPLGALYEQCISKGKHGQFFTPEPISIFMASCINVDQLHPGQTVYDPACGSGRMLLAAAKINRHLRFYGADIDEICCKMSVVNMILNSLTGEIAHMDTLSNDFYKGYIIGTTLREGFHYPYYREITNPEESYIWLRSTQKTTPKDFDTPFIPTKSPLMSGGVQGTLFD